MAVGIRDSVSERIGRPDLVAICILVRGWANNLILFHPTMMLSDAKACWFAIDLKGAGNNYSAYIYVANFIFLGAQYRHFSTVSTKPGLSVRLNEPTAMFSRSLRVSLWEVPSSMNIGKRYLLALYLKSPRLHASQKCALDSTSTCTCEKCI